jgi:maleate isomerase
MRRRAFVGLSTAGICGSLAEQSFSRPFVEEKKWQDDGLGFLGRIGVLTPDFDPVPESEMQAIAPAGISVHSSRVNYVRNDPSSFAEAPNIDQATALIASLNPKVILYAFTSSSYSLGVKSELELNERLHKLTNGIPIIQTCKAATDAFQLLGAKKICLIHPPWFPNEMNLLGKEYFKSQGFDIVFCQQLTPSRQFTEVEPVELYQWVRKNAPREADIIFIAGNGLRTSGTILSLEAELKKPVLAANQVLLWAGLRLLGLASKVNNYGKIFARS